MRSTLAAATAALCVVLAPTASASETTPVQYTEAEYTDATESGFSFYTTFAEDIFNEFRCTTSPQRWWCGGRYN